MPPQKTRFEYFSEAVDKLLAWVRAVAEEDPEFDREGFEKKMDLLPAKKELMVAVSAVAADSANPLESIKKLIEDKLEMPLSGLSAERQDKLDAFLRFIIRVVS